MEKEGWESTLLKWLGKLLLGLALLVTTPTTFWFVQKHVPDPEWYAAIAVLFVDGGAFFWFYNGQHRTRGNGQSIIAWGMFSVSLLGMATAFSLQVIGVNFPPEVKPWLEGIIVAVILSNILFGLLFEFADPAAQLRRADRKWHADQEAEKQRQEHDQTKRERDAEIKKALLQREIELAKLTQQLAILQHSAADEQAKARELGYGTSNGDRQKETHAETPKNL